MGFALDSETRRRLGYRLIDQLDRYFESLATRPVQLPENERTFGQLANALPELGEDAPANDPKARLGMIGAVAPGEKRG